MNCREFVDFLIDYVDDRLPAEQRTAFEAHLEACPGCIEYLGTYRRTVTITQDADGPSRSGPPDAIPEALVQAILAARKGKSE